MVVQVRPFTLGQLKELLGRTGTLVEDGFWIDKIKSHCYVTVSCHASLRQGSSALDRFHYYYIFQCSSVRVSTAAQRKLSLRELLFMESNGRRATPKCSGWTSASRMR